MAVKSFSSKSASVGKINDSINNTPQGNTLIQTQPTIPAAVFQASASTGTLPTQYYTKSSGTVLVLHFVNTAPNSITTGSLAGVFWIDSSGLPHFCPDCVISSVSGTGMTITAPTLTAYIAASEAAGQPSGHVADFTTVTAGTTQITVAIATLATSDTPANLDVEVSLIAADMQQMLITCTQTGATLLFAGSTIEFVWDYSESGVFANYSTLPGDDALPFSAVTITKARFYNSSFTKANVMSVGVNTI